jgi:Flp pilus assembly protein TadB
MAAKSESATRAVRDDVQHVRESMSRDNLEQKLERAIEERPAIGPFLDFRIVARAVAVAAVLTLIAALLASLAVAALVLVVAFFAAWAALAYHSYDKRRPTSHEDRLKDADEGGTDPAPFSG